VILEHVTGHISGLAAVRESLSQTVGFEIGDREPERLLQVGLAVGREEIPGGAAVLVLADILGPNPRRESVERASVTGVVLDRFGKSRREPGGARNGCQRGEFGWVTHEIRPPLPTVVPRVTENGRLELPSTQPTESLAMARASEGEEISNAFLSR
jgi:hypothetical protein